MTNINAIRRRSAELKTEVNDKLKALDNGALSLKAFNAFMVAAEAENNDLTTQAKAYEQAIAWRGGDGARVPADTAAPGDADARLTYKGLAQRIADAMLPDDGVGLKSAALAPSGAAVVAQGVTPDVVTLGRPAHSLYDVLPVKGHDEPQFAYLRQTARTNNAAIVADFATKPTSTYTIERVEDQLDVIAHLSEGLPRYWLLDNAALMAFVQTELNYGLRNKVEANVLSDIHDTNGIQTQDYSTSPVVTIRKSLTRLEVNELDPSAIVLHPSDWESIELTLASAPDIEYQNLPYDPAARRLYGVPVVTCVNQTQGTADILAVESVTIDTDTIGLQVQWSENSNATDFEQNLMRCRFRGTLRHLGHPTAWRGSRSPGALG